MFDIKGYFNEKEDAYTVLTPKTKANYRNCLMNSLGYGFAANQFGNGLTVCRYIFREQATVTENGERTIYFRDDETNDVWCIGGFPYPSKVDNYKCTHSQSNTIIESEHNGILVRIRIFVPYDRLCDIQSVEVINKSERKRKISIIPAIKLALTGFNAPAFCNSFDQSYLTDFVEEFNGVYMDGRNPFTDGRAPGSHTAPYNTVLASTTPVNNFSADNRSIFGSQYSLSLPYSLLDGEDLNNQPMVSDKLCMLMQTKALLNPGEKYRTDYILGLGVGYEDLRKLLSDIKTPEQVDKLYIKTEETDLLRRSKIKINTPDKETNRFINYWLKTGCEWSIITRRNPRDNVQFANATLCYIPEALKYIIENVMTLQYNDGHILRCWLPIDETHFADESMWLVDAVCDYIKFTGDYDILDKKIKYYDFGEESVWEHILKAVSVVDTQRGPHNIPLSHFADWNDALNTGREDPEAESVFVAMQLAKCFREMSGLCRQIGENNRAKEYDKKYEELKITINENCWDDEGYYIRSFSGGKPVGSSACLKGSKIFANPQSWSFISGVCPEERVESVYNAIDKYLESVVGCYVNYPAYTEYDPYIGRISFQYPGTAENGAIYAHATGFKIYADCMMGFGDRAFTDFKKLLPENPDNPPEVADTIPYAISNACSTADVSFGKSSAMPFSTGTMALLFRIAIEGFFGLHYAYGGFDIKPAMPSHWKEMQLELVRENTLYKFEYVNNNTGITKVYIDDRLAENNFVAFSDKNEVSIRIEL